MAVHTAAQHSSGQVLPFRESLMAMFGISFVTMLVALAWSGVRPFAARWTGEWGGRAAAAFVRLVTGA